MANVLYLRGPRTRSYTNEDVDRIVRRITPDTAPSDTRIHRDGDRLCCLINPSPTLSTDGGSVCLGTMHPKPETWAKCGARPPDGEFALVRDAPESAELVTDGTASRTLYYRQYDDLLVASTTQRGVMHFADDVAFDERAVAWMTSSGTLGPRQSWDARISHVPPATRLRFDGRSESPEVNRSEIEFSIATKPVRYHRDRLASSIDDSFTTLDIDIEEWVLPLSGGLDSREILLQLQDEPALNAVTWATEAARGEPLNDAKLARELADACDVSHRYLDLPSRPPSDMDTFFDRFLTAGEGRIDHVTGYSDGFETLSTLAREGTSGIIRGDEGFGWRPVGSAKSARHSVGGRLIQDFEQLPELPIPGKRAQRWPNRFSRHPNETPATWRDRLYHGYRVQTVLAALASLKTPYVEITNPFLAESVLEPVRAFPDELRTDKALYTEYVRNRSPDVPVADESAALSMDEFLSADQTRDHFRAELDTDTARSMLGSELVDHALDALSADGSTRSRSSVTSATKRAVGRRIPPEFRSMIERYTPLDRPKNAVGESRLVMRLYFAVEMKRRLERDVTVL